MINLLPFAGIILAAGQAKRIEDGLCGRKRPAGTLKRQHEAGGRSFFAKNILRRVC